jgi:hypothetical protein
MSMGGRGGWRRAVVMLGGILLAGCGYQPLGGGPPSSGQQVYVEAITNGTLRPGIQAVVGAALLRQLRLAGVLRAPETGPPDVILSGAVTAYANDAIAFDRIQQDVGRRFRVRVTLLATVAARRDGAVRLREAVTGEAFYTAGAGAISTRNAEDEALQRAAQDLASKLVTRLLEEW